MILKYNKCHLNDDVLRVYMTKDIPCNVDKADVSDTIAMEKELSVKSALSNIEGDLRKKLINKLLGTDTFYPDKMNIVNEQQFNVAINRLLSLESDFFLIPVEYKSSKYNLHASRVSLLEELQLFLNSLEGVFENTDTLFIYELFARLLAIRIVEMIREFNIPAIDCFTKTAEDIDNDTRKFFHYQPTFTTTAFTLEKDIPSFWCFKEFSGQLAAQSFIQQEMLNTGKNRSGSFQHQWETDTKLHSHVFAALKNYLFNKTGIRKSGDAAHFSLYTIAQIIFRRSAPTAFRSRTVPEVLYYLNQKNVLPAEGNSLFDSSMGSLIRFTGAMMGSQDYYYP